MNRSKTHQLRQFGLSLGITGLSISLMGFPATCTGPNQALLNSMDENELALHDEARQAKPVSKPKTWTVYCQREDGAKSKFTVSSELSDQISTSLKETDSKTPPTDKEATGGKDIALDAPDTDTDPFGESTVKCGKLLTLLAIFATVHNQKH